MKQCLGCLAQLEEDVEVCPYCGYQFKYVKRPNDLQGANARRRMMRPRPGVPSQGAVQAEEAGAREERIYQETYSSASPSRFQAGGGPEVQKSSQKEKKASPESQQEDMEEMRGEEAERKASPMKAFGHSLSSLFGSRSRGQEMDLEEEEEDLRAEEEPYLEEGEEEAREQASGSIPALVSSLFGNTGTNITRGVICGLIFLFGLAFCVLLIRGLFFQGKKLKVDTGAISQEQETDPESTSLSEDSYSLQEADQEIKTLVLSYFTAYNEKDLEAARGLLDELPAAEEQAILNPSFDHYTVTKVYAARDALEEEQVVLALYTYQLTGIDVSLPSSSWLYVKKDETGKWKILHPSSIGQEFRSFIQKVQSTEEAKAILSSVRQEYDSTLKSNPELQNAINEKRGQGSSQEKKEDMVRATTSVNVRATPSSEGELLGSVAEGDTLPKIATEGEWIQVKYKNQTAYVFGEFFVDASSSSEQAEKEKSEDSQEETAGSDQEEYTEEYTAEYSEEEYYEEEYYEDQYYEE